jgi:hypothetical protein
MRRSSTWPALLASSVNLPAPEKTDSTLAAAARVGLLLLRRRQGREVLARHLQLHPALDLHPPWVLPDALDVERLLLHQGQCALATGAGARLGPENSRQCKFGARANQPVPLAASGLFSVGVGLALPVPV